MLRRKGPICSQCDHLLDPTLEDGCDHYAIIGGEVYCEYCLEDHLGEMLHADVFGVAEQLGILIQETI